jgi:CheY-like chemotaxis protein/HD-like signal output (HDOD) protein
MDDPGRNASRPLVLVVDDDVGISAVLKRSLDVLGYDVLVAANGADAFEQTLHAQPAVVVTDVHMPGMDGHALLRRLMHAGSPTSVILMSGQGELDDAISALREGAVDYLKKPWTMDELTRALQRAMGLFDAYRALSLPPAQVRSTARISDAPVATPAPVDAFALVSERATQVSADGLALPALRPAVALLRQLARDASASPEQISAVIEKDDLLSAAVLRMASGTSSTERSPGDVSAAVAALDRETVYTVAETAALRYAFPIRVAPLRTLNDRIWRFSVSRALAMQGIADHAEVDGPIDRHQYYMTGLLLDVGASYLLSVIAEAMEKTEGRVADSAKMLAAVAGQHAQVGAMVLERWGFSAEQIALTRAHHADASVPRVPLWCAAALGGAVSVRLAGAGDPTGDRELRPESLARCAYTLGVGDTVLRQLAKSLTEPLEQIVSACA